MSYVINEDIVYVNKDQKLKILFIESDEVIALDNVVAEIFLMMAGGQDEAKIINEVKNMYQGSEDPETSTKNTIEEFLKLNMFKKKA